MTARDAIVVGLGGMGSAALYHLTRRGLRVLGIEQLGIGHALGSSHGDTRVIRKAYSEDPRYVPLLERSYELWRELEIEIAEQLLWITGALHFGPPDDPGIAGVESAVAEHDLPHERLDGDEIRARYPGIAPAAGDVGILEPDGGFLAVERCVSGHLEAAMRRGAEVRAFEPVLSIESNGDGVSVITERERYNAGAVVVCAGGWTTRLLELPLTLSRQPQVWLAPLDPELYRTDRFPVFIRNDAAEVFYGLPLFRHPGIKVCRHYGGAITDVDSIDRAPSSADLDDVRGFATTYLPPASGPAIDARICLYTNSPDHHFVIGGHPSMASTWIAAGFSGHGFKMSSVVGELLAELVEGGQTRLDIGMFAPIRFG